MCGWILYAYVTIATNLFHECSHYRYAVIEQEEVLIMLIKECMQQLEEQTDTKAAICFSHIW